MAGHYGKGYPARSQGVKTGRSQPRIARSRAAGLQGRVPDAQALRKDLRAFGVCVSEASGMAAALAWKSTAVAVL